MERVLQHVFAFRHAALANKGCRYVCVNSASLPPAQLMRDVPQFQCRVVFSFTHYFETLYETLGFTTRADGGVDFAEYKGRLRLHVYAAHASQSPIQTNNVLLMEPPCQPLEVCMSDRGTVLVRRSSSHMREVQYNGTRVQDWHTSPPAFRNGSDFARFRNGILVRVDNKICQVMSERDNMCEINRFRFRSRVRDVQLGPDATVYAIDCGSGNIYQYDIGGTLFRVVATRLQPRKSLAARQLCVLESGEILALLSGSALEGVVVARAGVFDTALQPTDLPCLDVYNRHMLLSHGRHVLLFFNNKVQLLE
jgi:hypothetical protein